MNDLKLAFRRLLKCPGTSFVAVTALAFGIGAVTLLFSVVNCLLLRPLPFENSNRLCLLERLNPQTQERCPFWTAEWPTLQNATQSFEAMAAFSWFGHTELAGPSLSPRRYRSSMASASLPEVLRVYPAKGRWFAPEEEQAASVIGGSGMRLRRAMVVVQVGLSLIVLIGSGLLVRSLASLYRTDRGFQTTNLVRFKVDPTSRPCTWEHKLQFCANLQSQLAALPGVRSVAFGRVPHLESYAWSNSVVVEGYQAREGENTWTARDSVSRNYCKTLGIPVKLGREFGEQDEQPSAPPVVIVNETFVRTYLPDRNPLGCHLGFARGPHPQPDKEIIRVVADFKSESLRGPAQPLVLGPYTQMGVHEMTVYVRTSLPSSQLFKAIGEQVHQLDSGLPIYGMTTMDDQLDRSLATERLMGFLSSAFGVLATVLAMIGLYGVMAYNVARRVREIGIRMALGAEPGGELRLILRDGLFLVGLGLGLGLAGAVVVTRVLQNLLFGIATMDPLTYVAAVVLLAGVALAACYLPARRAARINPMEALRCE